MLILKPNPPPPACGWAQIDSEPKLRRGIPCDGGGLRLILKPKPPPLLRGGAFGALGPKLAALAIN